MPGPGARVSGLAWFRAGAAHPGDAGAGSSYGACQTAAFVMQCRAMRGRVLAMGLLAVAAGAVTGCGGRGAGPPARPNVLLITLDTTRADRLGSYGYAAAATPRLDALAGGGVRFARALSPVPLTLPAHASLMTGRYPFAHGVRNNGHFTLPGDIATLAERFRAAGYDTAAFVSSFVLDRQFGLARGFGVYDDTVDTPPPSAAGAPVLETERRGDHTVAAALAWLSSRGDHTATLPAPYFLWVHLYDAHEPYAPPPAFAARFRASPYDGELAFVDAQVGALLDAAGTAAGGPLVVAAGDHGESLGDHGERAHGLFVYESVLRVPLILSWPGHLDARVVTTPVRLVDVAPTVLALSGLPALAPAEGRDLSPLLRGADAGWTPAPSYAETYFPEFFMGWAPLRAVDDGRWKYIDSPEPELYELASDPGETRNRLAESPATARALRKALEDTVRGGERSAATTLTSDAQRTLSALGYVSTPAPAPSGGARPAPARMVAVFERLTDGNRALADGRADVAVRIATEALHGDPGNAFAQLLLGRGRLALGDPVRAADALTAYLARVPSSADAHHWLALARMQRGDRARALAEEEAALAIDPGHAAAVALRAGLLFSMGRREEGVAALASAVEARPSHAGLRIDYADLLADAGRVADAEAQYRRVLETAGDDPRARAGLGILLARAGRLDDAVTELTRVLDADPRHEEARIERAAAYARLGRAADSRADLQRLTGPEVRPDIRRTAQRELARMR